MGNQLSYPWLRTELTEKIRELSSTEYQEKNWFSPKSDAAVGISTAIDFVLDSQDLDQDPLGAVGLYLYEDEVGAVGAVARKLAEITQDISDVYDSAGATRHKEWPQLVELAQAAVETLQRNDRSR